MRLTLSYPQAGTVDLTVPAGADHPNRHNSLTATAKGFIDLAYRPTSWPSYAWKVNGTTIATRNVGRGGGHLLAQGS